MSPRILPRGRRAWVSAAAGAALVLVAALVVHLWPEPAYPGMKGDCDRSELFVVGGTDVSLKNQRRALIRQWNEGRDAGGRPHPHATLVEVSESTDLQHSQIKAVEEAGGCAYDVLIMDNTWTAQFADSGYLRPLDGIRDQDDFFPAALRTGKRDGELYAVPFNVDVGLLYYREGVTPPSAWPGLVSSDVAMQLADYEGLTVNALEAVWNDGGAGRLTGEDRPSEDDLRTKVYPALARLAPRAHGTLAPSRQYGELESIEAFASGTKLMRNWPYAFSALASEPRMRKGARLRFGVTALPGHTVLGGQNLAVSKHSPNPGDAADLVAFLSGTGSQRLLFSCGGFAPGRYSALGLSPGHSSPADVKVQACSSLTGQPLGPGETDVPDANQLAQLGRAVVTALGRAEPRPVTPHYSTFTSTFRGCVQKIFDRAGTDAESFAEAVERSLDGRTASC
ncbi:extracellular solute-binding protein [Actinomadura darangshiensis]|uniref:Extracellular solute-binding protein n=1 Tax=Actinomadura darangshiensis TaxID=705336 RepID=A0A4R5B1V6_9ACTN|nr:extracellular solute-binding protein [Actinomadura darangshiensis]TDD79115.1 extracellular solute-binding protein [Actinomadura darangshiensis]